MAVHITYFVHGTTTDNEANLSSGWNDVALSELGRQQAIQLGNQTDSMKFNMVYTSDLTRAITTAELAWGDRYPVAHDSRLRECNYGDYNGKTSEIVEPLQEKSIITPMPGGESYEQVKARIDAFLADLRENYDGKRVAIVGHKAPQLALDVLLKNMSWEEAFAKDWRKTKQWQPGWEYTLV